MFFVRLNKKVTVDFKFDLNNYENILQIHEQSLDDFKINFSNLKIKQNLRAFHNLLFLKFNFLISLNH